MEKKHGQNESRCVFRLICEHGKRPLKKLNLKKSIYIYKWIRGDTFGYDEYLMQIIENAIEKEKDHDEYQVRIMSNKYIIRSKSKGTGECEKNSETAN